MNIFRKKKNIVIYTAIIGDYDNLIEQPKIENVDYICFTDDPDLQSNTWNIVQTPQLYPDSSVRSARIFKILSHMFFDYHNDYTHSIWIDGRIKILNKDLIDFLDRLDNNAPLAVVRHPDRDCLYEEAEVCAEWNLDDLETIKKQIQRYKKQGYPKNNGLVASGVIFRKNSSSIGTRINNSWWKEVAENSYRDQLSFNYIAWENKYNFKYIDINLWDNRYFKVLEHKKQ